MFRMPVMYRIKFEKETVFLTCNNIKVSLTLLVFSMTFIYGSHLAWAKVCPSHGHVV